MSGSDYMECYIGDGPEGVGDPKITAVVCFFVGNEVFATEMSAWLVYNQKGAELLHKGATTHYPCKGYAAIGDFGWSMGFDEDRPSWLEVFLMSEKHPDKLHHLFDDVPDLSGLVLSMSEIHKSIRDSEEDKLWKEYEELQAEDDRKVAKALGALSPDEIPELDVEEFDKADLEKSFDFSGEFG